MEQDSAVAPIENVASGIKPTAPYLDVATPSIPTPEPAPAETLFQPTSLQMNGHSGSEHHSSVPVADLSAERDTLAQDQANNSASIANILNDRDIPTPIENPPVDEPTIPFPPPFDLPQEPTTEQVPEVEMADVPAPTLKIAREREEDEEEEPTAKRTKVEESASAPQEQFVAETPLAVENHQAAKESFDDEPLVDTPVVDAPIVDTPVNDAPVIHQSISEQGAPAADAMSSGSTLESIMIVGPNAPLAPGRLDAPEMMSARNEDWGTLSDTQRKLISESLRNLKKGKFAGPFTKPVDHEGLKLPNYPLLITKPMDLTTMENKLKANEYGSVRDVILDFEQLVNNCYFFNTRVHQFSNQAQNLSLLFQSHLKRVPRGNDSQEVLPAPVERKEPLTIEPPRESKRRQSRPSLPMTSPKTSPRTFALADGLPQIRRDSTTVDGRPKREIHRPAHRDLPYSAKPKKKKFQAELRFCAWILDEMKLGRYTQLYLPFKEPVDPVALNIPQYRSIIKKPMDMQTITDKLSQGHYEHAKEFEADIRLMFSNCYKFNPSTNGIHIAAKTYEALFDDLMNRKTEWMAKNAPPSAPQSPEPGSDSEADDDDDDVDDDDSADPVSQLAAIHSQIQALTQQAAAIHQQSSSKPKKGQKKSNKSSRPSLQKQHSRKSGSFSGNANLPVRTEKKTPKAKPKTKEARKLTLKEKGEIAEGIGMLDVTSMAQATAIITGDLQKHGKGHKVGADEYEIEDISDSGLLELLQLVRRVLGRPEQEPAQTPVAANRAAGTSRPKKNKPMNKSEQDARIDALNRKLGEFSGQQGGAMGDGKNHHLYSRRPSANTRPDDAVESPDEYDSESEEE